MSTTRTVLSLFDHTGNMVRPWVEAGYDAVCVDLQNDGGYEKVGDGVIFRHDADVLNYDPAASGFDFDFCFGFPPCTDLAISGARWFRDKGMAKLIEALTLVERCRSLFEDYQAPYMIENPISTLSTYWRPPDFTFDPCDFGGYADGENDAYTKRTCLWVGAGFKLPQPRRIEPVDGSRMHRMSPGPERANLRSATPKGFARAVFEANCPTAVSSAWAPVDDGTLFGGAS